MFASVFFIVISGCRSVVFQDENNDDDDYDDDVEEEEEEGGEEENEEGEEDGEEGKEDAVDDDEEEEEEAKRMKETEQETEERNEIKSIDTNERQKESKEQEIARHRMETSVNADALKQTGTHLAKLRNEVDSLKNKYFSKLTTKCYQLKLHRTYVDCEEVIKNFNESRIVQPVLDKIKLIEGRCRTLDLWEILQSVNPRPLMKFGSNELFKQDSTLLENKEDMIFRKSIVLCSIFENLMRTLGWKVGDTLDIEDDICDVVGQMLMRVEKQDRSSLLECMQRAIMNIQVEGSKQDGDKLRILLIKKEKYNGEFGETPE